ncbi:MAG: nitroreductase family protein [Vallitaleaceae bacterium]|nr:nitroreductase family protein [Vallitaleaceae bacterium]
MEFFEVIEKRYSVRGYTADPVEVEKLDKILEAALLAPTACNLQAFKILVIKTEGFKEELRKIYKSEWFVEAPYVLCVCSIPESSWIRRDRKNYSDVDAAIVMDHLILAATDLGLGTCWIGAFDVDAARKVLDIEGDLEPIAFTPIGYAKPITVKKSRKSLEDLIIYK